MNLSREQMDEIEYKAKIELVRDKSWLNIIGLSKKTYDLYLKYPTQLELIRTLQEIIDDVVGTSNIEIQYLRNLLNDYRYEKTVLNPFKNLNIKYWD